MKRTAQWLIPLLFPIVLTLAWLCVLLSPLFIQVEYRRPGFPPDPYGFSTEERIHWADVSRIFLVSAEGPEYFSPYRLADGSPLYNQRELQHMQDVQTVVSRSLLLLAVCLPVFFAAVLFLFWKDRPGLRKAFGVATSVTLLLVLLTVCGALLAWNWVFVSFHRVFFAGDSWLFSYSDTLIRLFPVQFWQDTVAVAVAGISLTSLIIRLAGRPPAFLSRRKKHAEP